MKAPIARLAGALLLAALVAGFASAQSSGLSIAFNIGAKKVDRLAAALQVLAGRQDLKVSVDDAYVAKWIREQCQTAILGAIESADRMDSRPGGALDISDLTVEQRAQIKALIASFKQ